MAENDSNANKNNDLKPDPGGPQTASGAQNTPNSGGNQGEESKSGANSAAPAADASSASKVSTHPNYDGLAISEKLPVLFVEPVSETGYKLKNRFNSDTLIRNMDVKVNNAHLIARQMSPCLIVANIAQSQDVVKLLNLLKILRDEVRSNRVKFIVFSKITNPAIIGSFEHMGCQEYIIEPISERSLGFKMDLQTRALKSARKRARQEELRRIEAEKGGGKKAKSASGAKEEDTGEEKDKKVEEKDEVDGDVWVFRGGKPKKQGGKWTMHMKGPDPSKGKWVEVEKGEEGSSKWRFIEEDGKKEGEPGKEDAKGKQGWEWQGDKPTFNNGEWGFQGEKPDLSFVDENGKKKGSKVSMDENGGLAIAKDSEAALKMVEEQEKALLDEKEKKKQAFFNKKEEEKKEKGKGMGVDGAPAEAKEDEKEKKEDKKDVAAKTDEEKKDKKKLDFRDFAIADEEKETADFVDKQEKKEGSLRDLTGDDKDAKGGEGGRTGIGLASGSNKKQTEAGEEKKSKEGTDASESKAGKGKKEADKKGFSADEKSADPMGKTDSLSADQKNFLGGKGKEKKKNPFAMLSEEEDKEKKEAAKTDTEDKKGAFRSKLDEKKAKPAAKNRLAEMAMNLEEEKKDYEDQTEGEDKPGAFNNKLKKENEKKDGAAKKGLDAEAAAQDKKAKDRSQDRTKANPFAPSEASKAKEKEKEVLAEAKKKANPFAPKKAKESNEGEEDENADKLSDSQKNFLGKKKRDEDKPALGADEPEGGWSRHGGEGDAKNKKWKGHDSETEEDTKPEEDKVIEIDAPSGELNVKKPEGEEVYEYPEAHFGNPSGAWEPAGEERVGRQKQKIYVFVSPEIRGRQVKDFKTVPFWWIFRGDKPTYLPSKKVWVCKKNRPEKIEAFAKLPESVKQHLLDFLSLEERKKMQEELAAAVEGKKDTASDTPTESGDGKKKKELKLDDVSLPIEEEKPKEAEADKKEEVKIRTLPAAPMVAMVAAEILIRSKGDISDSLSKFSAFLSEILNSARVSIFCLHKANAEKGERVVKAIAGNDPVYPLGSEMSVTDKPDFVQSIDTCDVSLSSGIHPTLYFPVYVPDASTATKKKTIGLLVVRIDEKVPAGSLNVELLKKYFKGVSQCLRGQLFSARENIMKFNVKEAA